MQVAEFSALAGGVYFVGTRNYAIMDSTTVAAICGVVGTIVAGLGGWFGKQGMSTYLQYKDDRRKDIALEDAREDHDEEKSSKTLWQLVNRQDVDLSSLRNEVRDMRDNHRKELNSVYEAHNECERRFARLETEFKVRMEYVNHRCEQIETAAKTTNKLVAEQAVKGDSKVILSDKFTLPDGSELDPKDPDDAKLIQRWQKRKDEMEAKQAAQTIDAAVGN